MRRAAMVLGLCCVFLWSAPAIAQQRGAAILQQVTVRVVTRNVHTGETTLCLGFVWATWREYTLPHVPMPAGPPRDVTVSIPPRVVTAAHCLDEVASVPLRHATSFDDLGEEVRVFVFASARRGGFGPAAKLEDLYPPQGYRPPVVYAADTVRWNSDADVVALDIDCLLNCVLGWLDVGPESGAAFVIPTESRSGLPVLSMLSAGGGPPVVSSGVAFFRDGQIVVALPTAPGTSGALVVDLEGRLVGTVAAEATFVQGGAGFAAYVVPSNAVFDVAFGGCTALQPGGPAAPCGVLGR